MPSLFCAHAIEEAVRHGNAILKFVSANDVGLTGSHQCGFYLPKAVWQMFTPYGPEKGTVCKHPVRIQWPDGLHTDSVVTWYGQGTRSEYRLTRFGRDCPWLAADTVGNLLMLVPRTREDFAAFVFDREEDIEEAGAALGVEPFQHWGVYRRGAPLFQDPDECIARQCQAISSGLESFPSGETMSALARQLLGSCVRGFDRMNSDDVLLRCQAAEYSLFRAIEQRVSKCEIQQGFTDIDEFLGTAATIMNRRKARAGRSLENHVSFVLQRAGVPHSVRPAIDGEPDVVIPSAEAYRDPRHPDARLFIVGVKTTCKDRWRQVLNEGRRKQEKLLITTQPGISARQMDEMQQGGVQLVVPERLHREYPAERRSRLLTVERFVERVLQALNAG